MIVGLGSDLCDIRRVEKVMARFGDRFIERVFTPAERDRAARRTPARCGPNSAWSDCWPRAYPTMR